MRRDLEERLRLRELDQTFKGLVVAPGSGPSLESLVSEGLNILSGDFDFPLLALKDSALSTNIAVMADYCRLHNVLLAPHGKTTMAPQLVWRQLDAGAWGVTAATASQCRVFHGFDVPRILLANVLVDRPAIRWVAQALTDSPQLEFYCYVDSCRGVELMEEVLHETPPNRPLSVLLELGYVGGRTGCRSSADAMKVAQAVQAAEHLRLSGVSGFEGLMPGASVPEVMGNARAFLGSVRRAVTELRRRDMFDGEDILVTAGGSAYFDLVVEELGPTAFDFEVTTVLRSGCYVTHDSEMYEQTSPLAGRLHDAASRALEPAFELWSTVWSRPESQLAIVGFGKRDAPYDYRLPIPLRVWSESARRWRSVAGEMEVLSLNDQHAFVRVAGEDSLSVGDKLVCGISHPCGAFDKWRFIPVVDDAYSMVDGVFTYF